ncbi:MAG: RNA polymerase factor sigma-54 [Pseudomonadota bacterium]
MMHGLRLEIRQSQQLVMTPQLQQAIKLLQMSNLELDAHVASLLESNPLIVADDGLDSDTPAADPAAEAANTPSEPVASQDIVSEDPGRIGEGFDADLAQNVYDAPENPATGAAAGGGEGPVPQVPLPSFSGGGASGEALPSFEGTASTPDIREHLARQIRMARLDADTAAVALALIEALEEDGYLREPLSGIAQRLSCPIETVETALAALQRCEPVGIAARDLAECLALQLAERDRLDPMMRRLLDNLPLLQRGERHRLCLACGAQPEDIADMLADLRRLDPRPGHRFQPEEPRPRIADVIVTARTDRDTGPGWDISLNEATLPRVAMDQTYALRLDGAGRECDRWVAERRAEAQWLMRSMAKRADTILSVSREIVKTQADFFEQGASALKPMTLRQVAEATGLHESTISRVASGKLMATPRGLFDFKYFFTNAVGDQDISAESVRLRLRRLVDEEPPEAILSDDDLVSALAEEGMAVARRTVAKYRKMLGIPSSVERRRLKAFA